MQRPLRTFLSAQEGSTLVEFAMIATVLILLFSGVTNYAFTIEQNMQLSEAAAAGAAYGSIPGKQKDFTGMQNTAKNSVNLGNAMTVNATSLYTCTPGGASVTSSTICSGYGTPIEYVQVHASLPSHQLLNGIFPSYTLNATATYRVPWTP